LNYSSIRVVNVRGVEDLSFKYFTNATNMANELMSKRVKKGDIVIDATVGNGNDTIFLSELVGDMGKVYGFDIQATAIINTKKKLLEKGFLERTKLFEDSHENINSLRTIGSTCVTSYNVACS